MKTSNFTQKIFKSENVKTSYLLLLKGDIHGNPLLFLKISFHIGRIRAKHSGSATLIVITRKVANLHCIQYWCTCCIRSSAYISIQWTTTFGNNKNNDKNSLLLNGPFVKTITLLFRWQKCYEYILKGWVEVNGKR